MVKVLKPIISNPRLSVMDIQRDSPCAAALFAWVKKVVLQHLQQWRTFAGLAFVRNSDSQHHQEGIRASSNGRGRWGTKTRPRATAVSTSSPSLPSSKAARAARPKQGFRVFSHQGHARYLILLLALNVICASIDLLHWIPLLVDVV